MIFGGQPQDDWSPGEERVNRRWTHFFFAALLGNWLVLVLRACAAEGKHVDVSGSGDDFICFPRLIFIGRNLNRDELQRGFQSTLSWRFCSLRFRGPCCWHGWILLRELKRHSPRCYTPPDNVGVCLSKQEARKNSPQTLQLQLASGKKGSWHGLHMLEAGLNRLIGFIYILSSGRCVEEVDPLLIHCAGNLYFKAYI